jgi:hypothetical protein
VNDERIWLCQGYHGGPRCSPEYPGDDPLCGWRYPNADDAEATQR